MLLKTLEVDSKLALRTLCHTLALFSKSFNFLACKLNTESMDQIRSKLNLFMVSFKLQRGRESSCSARFRMRHLNGPLCLHLSSKMQKYEILDNVPRCWCL